MEINKICSDYFPFGIESSKEVILKEWNDTYNKWKSNEIDKFELYSRYIYLENALIVITSHEPESLPIEKEDLDSLTNFFTSTSFKYNFEDYFFHLIPDVKKRKISTNHLESLSKVILNEKDNIHRNRALAAYLNFFPNITYFDQPKNKFYIDNFKLISEGLYLKKKPEMFRPFFDILKSDGVINVIKVLDHTTPNIDWKRIISRQGHEIMLLEHLAGNILKMGLNTKYQELKNYLKVPKYTLDEEKIYIKSLFAALNNEEDLIREIQKVHPKSLVFNLKDSYFNTSLSEKLIKNGNWRIIAKFQDNYSLDELLNSRTNQNKTSSLNTIKALDKILIKSEGGITKGGLKSFVSKLFVPQTLSLPNFINSVAVMGVNNGNSFSSTTVDKIWKQIGDDKVIFKKPVSSYFKESHLGTGLIRKQFHEMSSAEWMERNNVGIPVFNFILGLAFHDYDKQFNFSYLYGEEKLIIQAFSTHDENFNLPIKGLSNLDILDERELVYNISNRLEKILKIWNKNDTKENRPIHTYSSAIDSLDFVQSLLLNMPFSVELSEDYVEAQKKLIETVELIQKSNYIFTSFSAKKEESYHESLERFQNKAILLEHKIMKQIVNSTMNKSKVLKF